MRDLTLRSRASAFAVVAALFLPALLTGALVDRDEPGKPFHAPKPTSSAMGAGSRASAGPVRAAEAQDRPAAVAPRIVAGEVVVKVRKGSKAALALANDKGSNGGDLVFVKIAYGKPVIEGTNYRYDIDMTGKINILDVVFTKIVYGNRLP